MLDNLEADENKLADASYLLWAVSRDKYSALTALKTNYQASLKGFCYILVTIIAL